MAHNVESLENVETPEIPAFPMTVPGRHLEFRSPDNLDLMLMAQHSGPIYSALDQMVRTHRDLDDNLLTIDDYNSINEVYQELKSAINRINDILHPIRYLPRFRADLRWINFLREPLNSLEQDYERNGFLYFGEFALSNPYQMAFVSRIPLTPATFEHSSETPLPVYREILQMLMNLPDIYSSGSREKQRQILEFKRPIPHPTFLPSPDTYAQRTSSGWRKKDLVKAIRRSGLSVQYARIYNRSLKGLPLSALGLRSSIYPGHEGQMYLPGIWSKTSYMQRSYYETIYRRIFNTLAHVDWPRLCGTNQIDLATLRFVAISEFQMNPNEILPMTLQQLCQALISQIFLRRQLAEEIAEEAVERAPQIIYQPGSAFVRPESVAFQRSRPQVVPASYQDIIDACNNLATTPKGYLIFLINRLGIRERLPQDLTTVSKEQLCRLLTRYVQLLQETRRPI